jgi:hypothetical protein
MVFDRSVTSPRSSFPSTNAFFPNSTRPTRRPVRPTPSRDRRPQEVQIKSIRIPEPSSKASAESSAESSSNRAALDTSDCLTVSRRARLFFRKGFAHTRGLERRRFQGEANKAWWWNLLVASARALSAAGRSRCRRSKVSRSSQSVNSSAERRETRACASLASYARRDAASAEAIGLAASAPPPFDLVAGGSVIAIETLERRNPPRGRAWTPECELLARQGERCACRFARVCQRHRALSARACGGPRTPRCLSLRPEICIFMADGSMSV